MVERKTGWVGNIFLGPFLKALPCAIIVPGIPLGRWDVGAQIGFRNFGDRILEHDFPDVGTMSKDLKIHVRRISIADLDCSLDGGV